MCPRAWDLVYPKPIVYDVTPCSSDVTLCSAKRIISYYFGGWKSKMFSDSDDSFGSDSFESFLVNFSLIWYMVWRCIVISCYNLAVWWSEHIWVNKRIFRRQKNDFLEISSTFKATSCLKWVFNYKKQENNSCHMHFKPTWELASKR